MRLDGTADSDPTYRTFVDGLQTAMADWYTYKPGKKDHYFAYYPHWKAKEKREFPVVEDHHIKAANVVYANYHG